jgi:hypothetical protein
MRGLPFSKDAATLTERLVPNHLDQTKSVELTAFACAFPPLICAPWATKSYLFHLRAAGRSWKRVPENLSNVNETCCRLSAVMYSIAATPTCPDLATRCHVNHIKSPQADAGAMTTDQCACLNKDTWMLPE